MVEAEKILLHPDMLSRAAGIEPTPYPLRQMLESGDVDQSNTAMSALFALVQGPNGHFRRIAIFAIGQLGCSVHPQMLELLEYQRENEKAPDVLKAIEASISTLQRMGGNESSELDRRRSIQQYYGSDTLRPWRPY
jgi:hypothetical protein